MTDKPKMPHTAMVLGTHKDFLVRGSYVTVHEPKLHSQSGKMEYSVAALVPKNSPDAAALKDTIEKYKKEIWLSKGKRITPKWHNPLRDGDHDTKQDGSPLGEECKGNYVINCKTGEKSPPGVVGTTKGADCKYVKLGRNDIKSGDYFRISVNVRPYLDGDQGIGVYLKNIQLVQQGEPLGAGQTSAEADFADFDDETDSLLD